MRSSRPPTLFPDGLFRWLILFPSVLNAADPAAPLTLHLNRPGAFQVVQRSRTGQGQIEVSGDLSQTIAKSAVVETRVTQDATSGPWNLLQNIPPGTTHFTGTREISAPGWVELEIRIRVDGSPDLQMKVQPVGVGEVFLVTGQSNSANHGEERQKVQSTWVSAAKPDGTWRRADDPQPGASGEGGSFIPTLGDLLGEKLKVPIGFISVGVGATSVREWLPAGTRFPNPPTLIGNVEPAPEGGWRSRGELYSRLVDAARRSGGMRAVLWHQGESDARQSDPSRTLSGGLYQEHMRQLIASFRRDTGLDAPWMVAAVSYHTPEDTGSPDIRAAQRALWVSGTALEGPDSDALAGELRDGNGRGIHFSGPGLRAHGKAWSERILPWLDRVLPTPERVSLWR